MIRDLRKKYHFAILNQIIRMRTTNKIVFPNFADGGSTQSVAISNYLVQLMMPDNYKFETNLISGQTSGDIFEDLTRDFIKGCFEHFSHIRPGKYDYLTDNTLISNFSQYAHLSEITKILKENETLSSALGYDYLIKPDIIVARKPIPDEEVNLNELLIDNYRSEVSNHTPLRSKNNDKLLLHASISCKWTVRSDRSQNTRTEALNLIRNRKGNTPHIVVVTAEPLPTRIASLALGTGDLDCVYHFALNELEVAVQKHGNQDQNEMLNNLVNGDRLRDISDMVFDLAI